MPHDIIDNRDQRLADHINDILATSDAARFAVGYFFLSGFEAIHEKLEGVGRVRLLIGNTGSRETLEQLAEAAGRLAPVRAAADRERYLRGVEQEERARETAAAIGRSAELMEQTDGAESLVRTLMRLIEQGRLEVRVYTRGRLHAKAYIFDYGSGRYEPGVAIVGSSNLSLSGLTHNSELNVVVHGAENHAQLAAWFDRLWEEAFPFDQLLLEQLRACWAAVQVRPYDIYMKSLFALVGDRLEGRAGDGVLWDDEITRALADFQVDAVRQTIQTIRDRGGAFVSDVVGLGKSFVGAAIVKHFERTERRRALILCPRSLVDMWEAYNETYQLNAQVLSMGFLSQGSGVLDKVQYRDRDFVLVDESHNFRSHASQRYEALQTYLARAGRRVCLLTATPRDKSAMDVYNQLKLFHPDDITELPVDPPNLKEYFKAVEKGQRRLQDLLRHVLIRRTRRDILRNYGFAEGSNTPLRELPETELQPYLDGRRRAYVRVGGRRQFFPRRELETVAYSIEATYAGLYQQIRNWLAPPVGAQGPAEALTYARYGLWHYVLPESRKSSPYRDLQRAGMNLRGLIRVMLFKRFESSVQAFRATLQRLEGIHGAFLAAMEQGFVPAGDAAQGLLYDADQADDLDLMDALRAASGRYALADFDAPRLRRDLEADRALIRRMLELVAPIGPETDAKLQELKSRLRSGIPQKTGKALIFTQYADTARYLYDALSDGGKAQDVESVYGNDKNKAQVAARFAPRANPQIRVAVQDEVRLLIATDVMSEGLNLQDCDVVVNYDLHWNPVRLIQRFGRIDRIGSENERIWGFNFLPETQLEAQLGLQNVLKQRIKEIHDTIGEDSAILDRTETLNEEAMFAIYGGDAGRIGAIEEGGGDLVDLNEAEELLRRLLRDDPEEFERIRNLPDGIRTGREAPARAGAYLFCQAGEYQQLMLLDGAGQVISKDMPTALGAIRCAPEEPAAPLPAGYNATVTAALQTFAVEAEHRRAVQKHSPALTVAQAYALRELRGFCGALAEEDPLRRQVSLLEEAFRRPVPAAVRRELNTARRNGLTGRPLVELLTDIYHEHGLAEMADSARRRTGEADEAPRIICSEALA